MLMRQLLLHVVMLVFVVPTFAAGSLPYTDPDYLIDTWEVEEGLPENSATAMVQASDGFLWFGTFNGLVRFDGVEFDVYRPSNTEALPSAGVVNLHLDQSNRQWISTYGGIVTRQDGVWRSYGKDDGWVGDFARTFAERPNGDLLITTFNGHLMEFSNGRFHPLPDPPGDAGKGYFGYADEDGNWWAIQSGFIGRWDGKQWVSMVEVSSNHEEAWGGKAIDGGLWLVQGKVLKKFQAGAEVSRVELPEVPGGLWGVHEDSEGNVWICTYDKGVCRVTPSRSFRRFGLGSGLAHNGVRFVFEDRERNIWIGTSGGGLSRFRQRRFHSFGIREGLSDLNVKAVSPDGNDGLWIATYGGGLFRKTGTEIKPFTLPAGATPNVQSVLQDRQGRLWVGTFGGGTHLIENGIARAVSATDGGGNNGLAFFEDSLGRIWMSGGQHVSMFDGKTFHPYGNVEGRPLYGVSSFAQTSDGAIWASNGSVFRLENDRFVPVIQRNRTLSSISLTGDLDGSLWIGMSNQTLVRWRNGQLSTLDARHGFSVTVLGMVEDASGHVWMATDNGVVRVEREKLSAVADGRSSQLPMQSFDRSDGLPSLICSASRQPVCVRDEKGRIWFATLKGVTMVDPAQLRIGSHSPPNIHFKEIRYRTRHNETDQQDALESSMNATQMMAREPFTDPITLPAGSRQIEVHFAAIAYANPESIQYEVKLNDYPWELIGKRRSAVYAELPPDDYVLHVRASKMDGVWTTNVQEFRFSIAPFWWQRTWVQVTGVIFLVILVAGIAGTVVHSRVQLRRQGEEHFRLAVESSPSAMVIVDHRGLIQLANRQAESIFGYDRTEMIGQPVEILLPMRFAAGHPYLRGDYMKRPQVRPMGMGRELYGRRKDGEEFPVEVGLTPLDAPTGVLVLASVTDITERRRAELESLNQRNELAHLSRVAMLGELSGSMAHELNQPLASILSNAQAAQRFLAKEDIDLNEVREILADIVEQDQRAGEVIRRLRLLLKKGEVQIQALKLNELVSEVLKLLRNDLVNHDVKVTMNLAEDLPSVDGDRVQLQQVLLNLVMNACDAMATVPASARNLQVITELSPDGDVHLRIVDAGCGIPGGSLQRIFDPFFTTKETGMGLGLAVCRTIITAHRGNLWATNNPEGGATLHCILPPGRLSS